MDTSSQVTIQQLITANYPEAQASTAAEKINQLLKLPSDQAWKKISTELLNPTIPFSAHEFLFQTVYPAWPDQPEIGAAWTPETNFIPTTNLYQVMQTKNMTDVKTFHQWSHQHYQDFWQLVIEKLKISFKKPFTTLCDLSQGLETPHWFKDAKINIVDSCFQAQPEATALVYTDGKGLQKLSYSELHKLVNQISNSLVEADFQPGDAIAIIMPMTISAIAIYLGIIQMGGVVVSIADSFSSEEIAVRLGITSAKAVFTQDIQLRNQKIIPLYEKIEKATSIPIIVLPQDEEIKTALRPDDLAWPMFLSDNTTFTSEACDPMQACNILFSSGTTATPKAIPWNHTTAIKSASDAYFHQNIQANDVLAWPTNLGWMMGPWLIFAAFVNRAAIAVYADAPNTKEFGKFIQDAKVTMLGTVPTLVSSWKQSQCMQGLDWRTIKLFSSTGECSNAIDTLYLMSLANYKPVIEYCGGTEIGGAYVSSTLLQNNCPAVFTTPTMGLDFVLLNDKNEIANTGQVALIPPSIGLSTSLLNANHHDIYFANMPALKGIPLRKHGDELTQYQNGFYSVVGRVDDSMNLGGIKISAAEIERAIVGIPGITESAAVAVTPAHNGPSQLVIYSVPANSHADTQQIKTLMQQKINQHLNPLFKIHDLILVPELPKTASNKIMRRNLRQQYLTK